MTNRHSGYVIVLEKDIREDDAEDLVKLFYRIRGVLSVKPVPADPLAEHIAKERLRHEMWELMLNQLKGS